jgi:hypothetical protein
MIDLSAWYKTLHKVTGAMVLRFNRASIEDLHEWAGALRAVAEAMRAAADSPPGGAAPPPQRRGASKE